tara:strand:+ start:255 stop:584 length:330 start_codon:yes stop_codon:yes gene_type:complete
MRFLEKIKTAAKQNNITLTFSRDANTKKLSGYSAIGYCNGKELYKIMLGQGYNYKSLLQHLMQKSIKDGKYTSVDVSTKSSIGQFEEDGLIYLVQNLVNRPKAVFIYKK